MSEEMAVAVEIRDLGSADLEGVVRIDARHTGDSKLAYWRGVFSRFLAVGEGGRRVGLAAVEDGSLVGYLLGEVRAFEFGSEPCGWVFAVGVEPERTRCGVGRALLEEAGERFRALGMGTVRTMVRRADVPVLAFFRSQGFEGGSFYQLELDLQEGAA